ncbi:MAG: hypothetical protein GY715_11710 [Planctomycetes bacterium]|nr:hypothetical protein [Planctomycetota bacterium]
MNEPDHQPGERFDLAMMWLLIAAFLLALPLMFVHPGAVLALFWMGLIVLALAVALGKLAMKVRRMWMRRV